MQSFVNLAAFERAEGELYSSPRAHIYLIAVIAAALMLAIGPEYTAIWLGLALLGEYARGQLLSRLGALESADARTARLALDIARSAALATAPAIAWYARDELGAALAMAMLCTLLVHAAHGARHGRRRLIAACAPYGLLAGVFLMEAAAAAGAADVVFASLLVLAFTAASILHRTRHTEHVRAQDAEWVRQFNMKNAANTAWELDYARREIVGAERLEALLGVRVSYKDIAENACFAEARDRALVETAFAPSHGPARRISVEHDMRGRAGEMLRLRHDGFIRSAPDGAPLRLTCVTSLASATPAAQGAATARLREAVDICADVVRRQARVFAVLNNETIGGRATPAPQPEPPAPAETGEDLAGRLGELLSTLGARSRFITERLDDLIRARDDAEAANLAKSQFLANMSHELRTPLNAILGYGEMLKEDAEDRGDSTAATDLDRILSAARHLLSLINEILDLSKIEAGRMEAAPSAFDAHELMCDIISTIQPLADKNGNRLTLRAEAGAAANTDATKLRQCVLNLLSNACKFTKDGDIEVVLERKSRNGVDHLFVTVSDTGIGMAPDHVAKLFQPFVQADPTITQRYGGTGLGLTITRRLCQLLGGDVSVTSALGRGSAFRLFVPANFSDAAAALAASAQVDEVQGDPSAPLVVVIEDENDARDLAARALTRAGFSVQGVGGGEAGMAIVRAKSPALVLLDIFLPDRSGWRVLQSLKQNPKTSDIPVVVLSVDADRERAMSLGAAEHLVKPADRDRLAATVMRLARKRTEPVTPSAGKTPIAQKQAG